MMLNGSPSANFYSSEVGRTLLNSGPTEHPNLSSPHGLDVKAMKPGLISSWLHLNLFSTSWHSYITLTRPRTTQRLQPLFSSLGAPGMWQGGVCHVMPLICWPCLTIGCMSPLTFCKPFHRQLKGGAFHRPWKFLPWFSRGGWQCLTLLSLASSPSSLFLAELHLLLSKLR